LGEKQTPNDFLDYKRAKSIRSLSQDTSKWTGVDTLMMRVYIRNSKFGVWKEPPSEMNPWGNMGNWLADLGLNAPIYPFLCLGLLSPDMKKGNNKAKISKKLHKYCNINSIFLNIRITNGINSVI